MTSFWNMARRYPPILCRLLARKKNGPPLTEQEIAARTALTVLEVSLISKLTTWDDVPLKSMQGFLRGCGVDFCNRSDMRRIDAYRRCQPTWKYLRRSGQWLEYYEPLLKAYLASITVCRTK
jgi:hypothetical protein